MNKDLSKIDIDILLLLEKYPLGLSLNMIAEILKKRPSNLVYRVKMLSAYGYIENNKSFSCSLKLLNKTWKEYIMILTCPFCKTKHIVDESIFKIKCSNKECKRQIFAIHKFCSYFQLNGEKEKMFEINKEEYNEI